MVVMIIYMAQMTSDTSRMVGGISGNPIPLLLPIVLSIILVIRNPIKKWNNRFITLLLVVLLWFGAIIVKYDDFSTSFLSYFFFLFYSIFLAYIHVCVYGKGLFYLYEDIIVLFAKITLLLWAVCALCPNVTSSFFSLFPETGFGNNFIYIYNYMDIAKGQYIGSVPRNAGFSWEPGRYSIMLCLAILCNLYRNGIRFRNNKAMIILLFSLVTTFSTTGYSIAIVLFCIFYVRDLSINTLVKFIFVILPILLFVSQLDFMAEKISDRANIVEANEDFFISESYYSSSGVSMKTHISLDRFQSMYFEWINFLNDPILGYSKDTAKSWFGRTFISDYSLTGGFVKIISQFGLILGIYMYYLLFNSSVYISKDFNNKKRIALLVCLVLSSISYPIFGIPVFTSFWLYGISQKR